MPVHNGHPVRKSAFSIARGIDLRFLMLGSMLPDIFDKPLGIFIFGNTLSNGRIFCHTLLFLVLLVLAGLWLLKYRRTGWLLAIAGGVFLHIILDEMWLEPATLFWPALGLEFVRENVRDWISAMISALTHNPKVYISEIAGLAIILCFLAILIARDRVMDFVLAGKYEPNVRKRSS
ncbi:MAG: hypothetical protein A2Z02_03655 [Chloroflexi bacterium RBG_16_48_7]|nr:MAG: hypothetical protein A2Z02_03655 [Chloroflexi bacterium RBG_16_48_7]